MVSKEVSVEIISGSDVGPVAELIQIASQFESIIHVIKENKHVNAKSLMGMMTLGVKSGDVIEIECEGPDEDDAIAKIESYLTGVEA